MPDERFFSRIAFIYDRFHIGTRASAERVIAVGSFGKNDEVLDLGGGTGRVARHLVGRVKKVVVADPSEGMRRECRKKKGLTCVQASAEKLPFEDATFDAVVMVDAFHHFRNHTEVARETARVLRDGGRVVIEEFHPNRRWGRVIAFFERVLRLKSTFLPPNELANIWRREHFRVTLHREQSAIYLLTGVKCAR